MTPASWDSEAGDSRVHDALLLVPLCYDGVTCVPTTASTTTCSIFGMTYDRTCGAYGVATPRATTLDNNLNQVADAALASMSPYYIYDPEVDCPLVTSAAAALGIARFQSVWARKIGFRFRTLWGACTSRLVARGVAVQSPQERADEYSISNQTPSAVYSVIGPYYEKWLANPGLGLPVSGAYQDPGSGQWRQKFEYGTLAGATPFADNAEAQPFMIGGTGVNLVSRNALRAAVNDPAAVDPPANVRTVDPSVRDFHVGCSASSHIAVNGNGGTGYYYASCNTITDGTDQSGVFLVKDGTGVGYSVYGRIFRAFLASAGTGNTSISAALDVMGWPTSAYACTGHCTGTFQAFENKWIYQEADSTQIFADQRATVRYNWVRATSSHNSYDAAADVDGADYSTRRTAQQILDVGIRSLEYDLKFAQFVQEWGVWHQTQGNNCGGVNANGYFVANCLADINAWHLLHPRHEVITIFLEPNDDAFTGNDHAPAWLDARIKAALGARNVYTPADLLARAQLRCSTAADLQTARSAQCGGWPTLAELRGKFIFVMTSGGGKPTYMAAGSLLDRVAFIAADYDSADVFSGPPNIPYAKNPNIVFYNIGSCGLTNPYCSIDSNGFRSAANVFDAGFVARVYRINNDSHAVDSVNWRVGFPATNRFEDLNGYFRSKTGYPGTIAPNTGYPFKCHNYGPAQCDTASWQESF